MSSRSRRVTAAVLSAALALAAFAPAASAGHKYKYRDRDDRDHGRGRRVVHVVHHRGPERVVIRDRSSSEFSALAGFVGGLIVGSAIHAGDRGYAPPPDRYDDERYYYDPYCDVRYRSLDASTRHFSNCRHPRVVQVVVVAGGRGRCVDHYRYSSGRWREYDPVDYDGYGRGGYARAPYDDGYDEGYGCE